MKRALVLALLAACSSPTPSSSSTKAAAATSPPAASVSSVDERIAYYQKRVDEKPRLYPVWIQLGIAYFDKAKEASDASWLAKAHEAVAKSMAVQETYEAYELKARLTGHAHRFEEAIEWARKAAAAASMPPDHAMRALEVEALVGLGKLAEAKALLPAEDAPIDEFFDATALARIANEEQRLDRAAALYKRASELARAQKAEPLIAWAEAMAGGMLLDDGNLKGSLPHLDESARHGGCPEEAIHRAEHLAASNRRSEALAAYEKYLAKTPDPGIHHAAFALAKEMGDEAAATRHYQAAELGYRKVVDAGEMYTLGALAQLLLDGKGDVREALALAEKNSEWKRDREARETLAEARERASTLSK